MQIVCSTHGSSMLMRGADHWHSVRPHCGIAPRDASRGAVKPERPRSSNFPGNSLEESVGTVACVRIHSRGSRSKFRDQVDIVFWIILKPY